MHIDHSPAYTCCHTTGKPQSMSMQHNAGRHWDNWANWPKENTSSAHWSIWQCYIPAALLFQKSCEPLNWEHNLGLSWWCEGMMTLHTGLLLRAWIQPSDHWNAIFSFLSWVRLLRPFHHHSKITEMSTIPQNVKQQSNGQPPLSLSLSLFWTSTSSWSNTQTRPIEPCFLQKTFNTIRPLTSLHSAASTKCSSRAGRKAHTQRSRICPFNMLQRSLTM